jgi:predicted kinase
MFDRAQQLTARGLSVVLDGTFLTNDLQRGAVTLATALGAQPLLVNCICPPETAARRIEERVRSADSLSEARTATHERQRQEEQPPPRDIPQCQVDTSCAMPMMTRTVLDALKTRTPLRRTAHAR